MARDVGGWHAAPPSVQLIRDWNDGRCQATMVNKGSAAIALKEVILFSLTHTLARDTPVYGEGFQMLSQTGGTVGGGRRSRQLHGCQALPDAGTRGRSRGLQPAHALNTERAPGACVHFVPPVQRPIPVTARSHRRRARPGRALARSRRELAARRVRVRRAAPIERRCWRRSHHVSPSTTDRSHLHHLPQAGARGTASGRRSPRSRCSTTST